VRVLFWASTTLVLYTFVGYAAFIRLLAGVRPRRVKKAPIQPTVSIVIAVHNGAGCVAAKLNNLSALIYPRERLEIIVASDGSTDGTEEILNSFRNVKCVLCPRVGKAEALNRALTMSSSEIVVFTDIRQRIEPEAMAELVSNFADEEVGCVSGELMFSPQTGTGSASGISAYWRLEKLIRKCESDSGSVMGATGALYAVRRSLIKPLPIGTLLDDVYIPLEVLRQGKRVIFEPKARVWDAVAEKSGREFLRKVRTLAGNFQLVELLPWVLTDRRVRFRFVSHKLMRLLAPWLLLMTLLSAWGLSGSATYLGFALLETAVYALALVTVGVPWLSRFRLCAGALAFTVMNLAAGCAAFQYLRYRRDPARLWVVQAEKTAVRGASAVAQEP
jgi:cellulose synthase/poly-beta-1,6-N-acetylglucosamine synthase-like glycosyltransferase